MLELHLVSTVAAMMMLLGGRGGVKETFVDDMGVVQSNAFDRSIEIMPQRPSNLKSCEFSQLP